MSFCWFKLFDMGKTGAGVYFDAHGGFGPDVTAGPVSERR